MMGKKVPIASLFCGVFNGRRRTPSQEDLHVPEKGEDVCESSTSSRGGDSSNSPEDTSPKATSKSVGQSPEQQMPLPLPLPLPPPPGSGHTRTVSCHPGVSHHMRTLSCQPPTRSDYGGVSRLVSSLSLGRVIGGSGREEKGKNKQRKLKREDSVWKKTIILGEKCRVPDEDEDHILYDEKGNKISTYHPKSHSGLLIFPRDSDHN